MTDDTNPLVWEQTDLAVALRYDHGDDSAPRVVASGRDDVARDILAIAREAGVTEYPQPELADVLARVPVGDEIPPAMYRAIAEVIAFAYWVNGRHPEDPPPAAPGAG